MRARRQGKKRGQGRGRIAAFVGRVTVSGNERGRFQAVAPTNRTPTGELWIVEPDRIRFRVEQRLSAITLDGAACHETDPDRWMVELLATAIQPGPKAAVVGDVGVGCMWITFMPAPGKLASVRVADEPAGDPSSWQQSRVGDLPREVQRFIAEVLRRRLASTIGAESLIVRWFKRLTTSLTSSGDFHGRPHPNNFHCGCRNADHQVVQELHRKLIGRALGVQLNIDDVFCRSDFGGTFLEIKRADDYAATRSSVDDPVCRSEETT